MHTMGTDILTMGTEVPTYLQWVPRYRHTYNGYRHTNNGYRGTDILTMGTEVPTCIQWLPGFGELSDGDGALSDAVAFSLTFFVSLSPGFFGGLSDDVASPTDIHTMRTMDTDMRTLVTGFWWALGRWRCFVGCRCFVFDFLCVLVSGFFW